VLRDLEKARHCPGFFVSWLAGTGQFPEAQRRVKLNANGAVAQLGERVVRNDEVVGSIPISSTNFACNWTRKSNEPRSGYKCSKSTARWGGKRVWTRKFN
jgi:hypothetical protein